MKHPTLGLALSTVAFGASSIYLWTQLAATQEQARALDAANAELTARVAELQRRRDDLAQQQVASLSANAAPSAGPRPEGVATAVADAPPASDPTARRVWTRGGEPPEMPEAMRKMLRTQMRAQNKRMYFDLQAKLGLTDAQTSDLLDLLTDQQALGFKGRRNLDPDQARNYWEEEQAKRRTALEDLLGASKAAQFEEYQKSMPARSELMMISQQMEGVETPLTESQRNQLLDALIAERERIPMPAYVEGAPPEDGAKAFADWQADYEKRVADAARGILTAEQLNTYSEYQQWQREMRQQFSAESPRGVPGRARGGTLFMAAPIAGVAVDVTTGSASSRPTEKSAAPK